MNILLISANLIKVPYPVFPLGMDVVASVLRKAGHSVRQIDPVVDEHSLADMDRLLDMEPEVAGVSIRNIDNVDSTDGSSCMKDIKKTVKRVKDNFDVPVILGGAGFSLMPGEILDKTEADFGIVGEAEPEIIDLVERIGGGEFPSKRLFGKKYNPDPGKISGAGYNSELTDYYVEKTGVMSVQTKRGCHKNCEYCSYPVIEGKLIRSRPYQTVVEEIRMLEDRFSPRHIVFTDSVFNQGDYLDLVEKIRSSSIETPWSAFFTPENLEGDEIELMKEAGLSAVEIGADGATDETLSGLNKNFTFEDIHTAGELFARYDIPVANYFIFGGPGETPETLSKGIENIKKLPESVAVIFMGVRILPGTGIERIAKDRGVIRENADLTEPHYYFRR